MNADVITLGDAKALQHMCKAVRAGLEFGIGHRPIPTHHRDPVSDCVAHCLPYVGEIE
jgi:hypothetical protein